MLEKIPFRYFEAIEKKTWLLGVMIAIFVSFGGLAEITPLFAAAHKIQAPEGVKPYTPLRLAGFEIYVKNGCYLCHSQQIRHLSFETQRYGPASTAGESIYDRPFQWGSKRTGPDLARIGGKYSDDWQRVHLMNPRDVVPESNMPRYNWLVGKPIDVSNLVGTMKAMKELNTPYTDADIAGAAKAVEGKDQMDALIAYLQGLGIDNKDIQGEQKEVNHL